MRKPLYAFGLLILALLAAGSFPGSALAPLFTRPPAPPMEATVLFGGDLMFDRTIRLAMVREGADHPLSCLAEVLAAPDLVVANLEGPVTSNPSVSVGSVPGGENNFTFTFPVETPAMLARYGITLVNLGNNHIMNFGSEGLAETKVRLAEAGVAYFGDPAAPEAERVARIELEGVPLSFVSWSDWTSDKTDHTVAQVVAEKAAGRVVVVYTHWGEEYVPPSPRVRALAHSFVDAGASLVIGSHPHVVLERERYEGADIYYSLGNMVFDQYWNDEVSTGLLVEATFTEDGVSSITERSVRLLRDGRTCPAEAV